MRKEFNEGTVVEQLAKKSDLDVIVNTRTIKELTRKKSKGDVGIKSKGKIDFLTKYKGWNHYYVDSFN